MHRAAFSMIGMLISLVIMLVLAVILMNSMNKTVTGSGSIVGSTVRSFEDQQYLRSLHQSLVAWSQEKRGAFLVPSELDGRADRGLDTTANLYSALVMENYTVPSQIVSSQEFSPNVWVDDDYDQTVYDPRGGVYWDPSFVADLDRESNTSYAHVPLYGERFKKHWQMSLSAQFPLLGNRGPKDGIDDPMSYTIGNNGTWGGNIVFGDGSVKFVESATPPTLVFERDLERYQDNLFVMDDGPDGVDAILSFTKEMTTNGPELQFD